MDPRLTPRQAEVYAYLAGYLAEHGYPPTFREINDACHLGSTAGSHRILAALERKGLIERAPGKRRAIRVRAHPAAREPIDPAAARILNTIALGHASERDCLLLVAARVDSPELKDELLRDAVERHELVRSAEAALCTPIRWTSRCEDFHESVMARLVEASSSAAFVVHSLLFNSLVLPYNRYLVERGAIPALQPLAVRSLIISERSLQRALTWVARIHPSERRRLSTRAEAKRLLDGWQQVRDEAMRDTQMKVRPPPLARLQQLLSS
jgi:hypothetical protein